MPTAGLKQRLFLLIGDFIGYILSVVIIIGIDFGVRELVDISLYGYIDAYLLLLPFWVASYYIFDLYSKMMNRDQINLFQSAIIANFLNSAFAFVLFHRFEELTVRSTQTIFTFGAICFITTLSNRRLYFHWYLKKAERLKVLLVGDEKDHNLIQREFDYRPTLGYQIDRVIGHDQFLQEFDQAVSETKFDLILVNKQVFDRAENVERLLKCMSNGFRLSEFSSFVEKLTRRVHIDLIEGSWFLNHSQMGNMHVWDRLKSLADRFFALFLLILLFPLFALVYFIGLITMGFPVFFVQRRVGHLGKEFQIFKFRSMTKSAEKNGAQWAKPNDQRITLWGKFIRKTRLDELPQLVNILMGDMSFIGPRPERPEFTAELEEKIKFFNERHLVKPGLTGWAQVSFRYGFSVQDSLEKLQFDLYYIKNRSPILDIAVILKTIRVVIFGSGQ